MSVMERPPGGKLSGAGHSSRGKTGSKRELQMRRVGTEKGEARGSGVRSNTVAKALTQTVEKGENRGFSKDSLTGQSELNRKCP